MTNLENTTEVVKTAEQVRTELFVSIYLPNSSQLEMFQITKEKELSKLVAENAQNQKVLEEKIAAESKEAADGKKEYVKSAVVLGMEALIEDNKKKIVFLEEICGSQEVLAQRNKLQEELKAAKKAKATDEVISAIEKKIRYCKPQASKGIRAYFAENVAKNAEANGLTGVTGLNDKMKELLLKDIIAEARTVVSPVIASIEQEETKEGISETLQKVNDVLKAAGFILPAGYEITVSVKGRSRFTAATITGGTPKNVSSVEGGKAKSRRGIVTATYNGITEEFGNPTALIKKLSGIFGVEEPKGHYAAWDILPKFCAKHNVTFSVAEVL